MNKYIDVVLIIVVCIIVVALFVKFFDFGVHDDSESNKNKNTDKNKDKNKDKDKGKRKDKKKNTRDTRDKKSRSIEFDTENNNLKPFFLDVQFHNNYRDTITAFNDIAPAQKLIFNQASLPATYTNPNPDNKEVVNIVNNFIKEVNRDVQKHISDYRTSNTGWDEYTPDKRMDGWEKQMQDLGLPPSLYSDPAKRSEIKLIKIDNVDKFVTEFQTKYDIVMIVQKPNVEDQMVVKMSFVKDNLNINKERQFFDKINDDYDKESGISKKHKKKNDELNMVIEEIFVVGFLTDEGLSNEQPNVNNLDFYNFKGLEANDISDGKQITKELVRKFRLRDNDRDEFVANLDPQTQKFRNELPDISDYKSYKCTRSIFDDLNGKKIVYE